MRNPSRGEVWRVNLDPSQGHEQGGTRPALVLSVDGFNHGPAGLVIVAPITSKDKGIPYHVRINPPEGGCSAASFIKCEDVRSISKQRLGEFWGAILPATMAEVEDRIRILLSL